MSMRKLMHSPRIPSRPHSQAFPGRQLSPERKPDPIGSLDTSARASSSIASRPTFGQNIAQGLQAIGSQFNNLGKQLDNLRSMVAAPQQAQEAPQLYLGGKWRKDKQASDMDGYGRSLDLMGIHGFKKKTAMVLMDGLEISQDNEGVAPGFRFVCGGLQPLFEF